MKVFPLVERIVRWHPDTVDARILESVLDAASTDDPASVLTALKDPTTYIEPSPALIVGEKDLVPTGWSSETLTDGTPVIRIHDPIRFRDRLFLTTLPERMREIQSTRRLILDLRFERAPQLEDIDPMLSFLRRVTPGADIAFRAHIGFASEDRSDTGDYRSEWRERRMPGTSNVHLAVLVNTNTPQLLPLVAAARDGNLLLLTDDLVRQAPVRDLVGLPYTAIRVGNSNCRIRTTVSLLSLPQPLFIPAGTSYKAISEHLNDPAKRTSVVPNRLPGAANIPMLASKSTASAQLLRAQVIVAGLHPHLRSQWSYVPLGSDLRDTVGMRVASALRRVSTALSDGHAQVLYRPLADAGIVPAPVRLRVLEGQLTVVQRYGIPPLEAGVELGDVIETINGLPWKQVAKPLAAELSASTAWAHSLYVCNRILAGPSHGIIRLGINRGGKRLTVELPRIMTVAADGRVHERLGPPYRMLTGNIGYLDLDNLTQAGVTKAIEVVGASSKWMIDARGQGNMVAWDLAPMLTTKKVTAGVCVTKIDIADVGAAQETQQRRRDLVIEPSQGARRRKVVVLVDERTQSQSEVSALFFKAVGAVIVGSRTAGTVGDVTDIQAHPEVRLSFSGQDVLTPQGVSLHGRGLDIDVQIRETPAAVRSGRDLPLEAALRILRG